MTTNPRMVQGTRNDTILIDLNDTILIDLNDTTLIDCKDILRAVLVSH